MPPVCSICRHEHRHAIDQALVACQGSLRDMARQWSVSKDALARHRPHVSGALVQAAEADATAHGETLLEQVKSLQRRALQILARAEQEGDLRAAIVAIKEAREILEFVAKLTGELERPPDPRPGLAEALHAARLRLARLRDGPAANA